MKDISSRSDRVATEEELETGAFGSSHKTISRSLVPTHIHIETRFLLLPFDMEGSTCRCVCIGTVVVPIVEGLDVGLTDEFFLSKLLVDKIYGMLKSAVE